MEREQLNFKFEFTDEFNQTTKFEQNINTDCLEVENQLGLMVQEFKQFLLACGHSQENLDSVFGMVD